MNIYSLGSLLLELAHSNVNRVAPTPKAAGLESTRDPSAFGKKVLEGLDLSKFEKQAGNLRSESQKTAEPNTNQPNFAPLPLRSELFPGARFFIRLDDRDENGNVIHGQHSEIFVYVETDHMGPIWVSLAWINNSLSVKYYTENEETSKILKESFPEMRGDLIETGFHEIALTSQSRNNLGSITSELLPKFDAYLLNQRV